jgi:hypothetical protein
MAERVGFVPGEPAPINNFGPFSIARIARNAQNLNIRDKTGTADSVVERLVADGDGPSSTPVARFTAGL